MNQKRMNDNSNGEEFSGDDSGCEDDSSDEESHPPDKESQDDNHVETASHENDFSVKTQRVATRTTGLSHFILNRPLHHTIGRPHHLLSFSYRLFNFFDRQHTPLALVVSGHYVSGSFSSFLNATIS